MVNRFPKPGTSQWLASLTINPKESMSFKEIRKILARLRFKIFSEACDRKVHRIFAHLNGNAKGLPFRTSSQMNRQTELRDVRALLDLIDLQAPEMGKATGEAIRFIVYRETYERLELYVRHVQRRVPFESRVPSFTKF